MPYKKAVSRYGLKAVGFRIIFFIFGHLYRCHRAGAAALVVNMDIAQPEILDIMSRYAADNGAVTAVGVIYYHIADKDPAAFAHLHAVGRAHPGAQPDEEWGVGDIPH